ncbi:MAG: cytochrome c family protein [Ignavibacteriales bacterium]|nr:cytochrome c family protein [Ignavibacteriales bacterium]
MTNLIKFCSLLIIVSLTFGFTSINSFKEDKKSGFVGAEKCGMCHKSDKAGKQFTIWQGSKHANAYKALQTQKADDIAKAKGFKTKAVETKACLKCHASGYDVDAALKTAKFKVEDGVQCETCHGPGSEYQQMSIMKNRDQAISKGLVIHKEKEKFCTGCHNSESPTFKSFKYEEAWGKIAHSMPKG